MTLIVMLNLTAQQQLTTVLKKLLKVSIVGLTVGSNVCLSSLIQLQKATAMELWLACVTSNAFMSVRQILLLHLNSAHLRSACATFLLIKSRSFRMTTFQNHQYQSMRRETKTLTKIILLKLDLEDRKSKNILPSFKKSRLLGTLTTRTLMHLAQILTIYAT